MGISMTRCEFLQHSKCAVHRRLDLEMKSFVKVGVRYAPAQKTRCLPPVFLRNPAPVYPCCVCLLDRSRQLPEVLMQHLSQCASSDPAGRGTTKETNFI